MEDNLHPGELSQVEDTPRPTAASLIAVAPMPASENAGRKRKIDELEENLVSGHAAKSQTNSQGRAIIRRVIILLDSIDNFMGENACDKDDDHNIDVTLILGQDGLQIGYVVLKNTSDSNVGEHNNHLHMPKKLGQRADIPQGDVNGDRTITNVQPTAQAHWQQLLYDIEVEHAHDLAEMQREMLQMRELAWGGRYHKKVSSPPPKRKSMMHEYHPDGGQSIRWLTDDEFEPYDELSAEEGSPVAKVIGGPASCELAARRHMSLSRRWALRHFQKVKDTWADMDDEPVSAMHRRANGTPEI
ncbi:hypothetical protein F4604DRAFT_1930490 [Suillus subluteus]|nr:hypothetical protein F4604DRAFT_1930490 [Suillus subluteus]